MEKLFKFLDDKFITYSEGDKDIEIPYFLDDVPTEEQWEIMYLIGQLNLTYKYYLDDNNTLMIHK